MKNYSFQRVPVLLFLFLSSFAFLQEIQLNINSNNIIYRSVIQAAVEHISTNSIEVHTIALFVHNQSYNSIFKVILAKQINTIDILIVEIKIFTGKSTSGRNDIFYNEIISNFSFLHFIEASYLTIQQAAEDYLTKGGKNLKYLQSIQLNNEGVFIIHPVITEGLEYVLVGSQWKSESDEVKQSDIVTGMFRIFRDN